MSALEIIDLGLCDYGQAYTLQKDLVRLRRKNSIPDTLVLVEHPEVYTYGRKNRDRQRVENGVSIERGGESTFHNPGQLVAYPILYLAESDRDLHKYLRRLERVVIQTLSRFDIAGAPKEGATGVWVEEKRKIASIGIAVSGWTTYHGLALNVENDLTGFSKIDPCGFPSSVMTSLKKELGDRCPSLSEVEGALAQEFHREFF